MTHTAVETDMAFAILAVAHGYEVVAIALGKGFGAALARLKGFYNVHVWVPLLGVSCVPAVCPALLVSSSFRALCQGAVGVVGEHS